MNANQTTGPRHDLGTLLTSFIDDSGNPDMQNYYAGALLAFRAGADERFQWTMRYIASLARLAPGKRALDVGCGFGVETVALALVSGATLVANDIRPTMTGPLAEGVARLREKGVDLHVETLTGDICVANLASAAFDAIICNQTVEHVHDLLGMFEVCHRVLKPGGRLVITNDNNALHPGSFRNAQEYWQKRDRDAAFVEKLRRDRPIENADVQPYAVMRESIIRAANPSLDESKVQAMAAATAGLTETQIRAIAAQPDAPLPVPPALSWCRDPITGEYAERLLDPFDMAKQLRSVGFRATVRHGFRKPPLRWLNAVGVRSMHRMLFRLRPYFVLVATKPG